MNMKCVCIIIALAILAGISVFACWRRLPSDDSGASGASEAYTYCTHGNCYTLLNNNYDGVEQACTIYPPPCRGKLVVDAPETIPFAEWRPSACAGIYTTVLDGAENRESVCGV